MNTLSVLEYCVGVPEAYAGVIVFLFGAMIGSFLNMAIWRLPLRKPGVTVFRQLSHPARSYCPRCEKPLSALDNIPLLSFLALRARCRQCKAPISWRYFCVELLTAGLFLALYLRFGQTLDTAVYCLFFAALIAALFIDLAHFIIPDELNTFALLLGFTRDAWGITHGEIAHALLWGWLPRSLLGAVLCAGVFVFIQLLGLVLFRKESMGDGDVKLARAIGALLPLGQALVSFLLAITLGAIVGGSMKAWETQQEKRKKAIGTQVPEEPEAEEEGMEAVPLWSRLIWLFFLDLFVQAGSYLRIPAAVKLNREYFDEEMLEDEEDTFVIGPTHIQFGPYMVVGAALAVFWGDALIQGYLRWSGLIK